MTINCDKMIKVTGVCEKSPNRNEFEAFVMMESS
jgi:hypothetical protein